MGALGDRDGGGVGRPEHGRQQHPGGRCAEVHPHRASVRPGRSNGPTGDVLGRGDAWQQYGHPPGAVQAGVLRQELLQHDRVHGTAAGLAPWEPTTASVPF